MEKSLFHKILILLILSDDDIYMPQYSELEDALNDWVDEAASEMGRCTNNSWELQDIDPKKNKIYFAFEGEDAHSGQRCYGGITADFNGEVKSVAP